MMIPQGFFQIQSINHLQKKPKNKNQRKKKQIKTIKH